MDTSKNVLLITIDCLRADRLSCLGYERHTTHSLDQLAKNGAVFTQAISNSSWTPQSFKSILTSTYSLMYNDGRFLSPLRPAIQEVLRQNGYVTSAFHSNPYLASHFGYDRGFCVFDDSIDRSIGKSVLDRLMIAVEEWNATVYRLIRQLRYLNPRTVYRILAGKSYTDAETINRRVLTQLAKTTNKFFIWAHYMDVHFPWMPQTKDIVLCGGQPMSKIRMWALNTKMLYSPDRVSKTESQLLSDMYDAKVRYVDRAIGDLLQDLQDSNVLDETLIIVTADHGELLGERGSFGHGRQLYDPVLRVPFIILHPHYAGTSIDCQIELLDVAPTIADFLGVPPNELWLGRSLLPLLNGERTGTQYVISEFERGTDRTISVRTPDWKLIKYATTGERELYHLSSDPGETQNLSAEEKRVVEKLEHRLAEQTSMAKLFGYEAERARIRRRVKQLRRKHKL